MTPRSRRTALVTGANRGIGLEVSGRLAALGLEVVLTGRDAGAVAAATQRLRGEGHAVRGEVLDVTDPASVFDCARRVAAAGRHVDVLVNNAGVYPTQALFGLDERTFVEALQVNLLGAFRTTQAFAPGMAQRGFGRVVNVSSGGGAMTAGTPGPAGYGVSKAALNALTLVTAAAVPPGVKVNAVCPGWVRTRMGGADAPRSVAEAADTVVWLATLPDDGPTGRFFRDRQEIPW